MISPLQVKISNMGQPAQGQMRQLIRGVIGLGFVKSDVGLEATEEMIEHLIDGGRIKISVEPVYADGSGCRFLLYDQRLGGYRMLHHEITLKNLPLKKNSFMTVEEQPGILIEGS